MRLFPFFAATVWVAVAQTPHQHHPPRDAAEYAKVLEHASRDAWQKPHEVILALKLDPAEVVADIGAGSGYFTRRLARHAAKVYAVDVDRALLDRIGEIDKVERVHAAPDDPKLPPRSVDTIFICNVLHHIDGRPAYYSRLARALKPGGRIVLIDFFKKPLPVGPPEAMKLSEDEVRKELEAAGFRLERSETFLPHQYFLTFR